MRHNNNLITACNVKDTSSLSKYKQENYMLTEEDKAELISNLKLALADLAEDLLTPEYVGGGYGETEETELVG